MVGHNKDHVRDHEEICWETGTSGKDGEREGQDEETTRLGIREEYKIAKRWGVGIKRNREVRTNFIRL